MTDGWSGGRQLEPCSPRTDGLGMGLGAVRRLMNEVDIETSRDGTTVVAREMDRARAVKFTVHWATRPCRGEANGDGVFVKQSGTRTVFAVIDALGHGPIAAHASSAAIRYLDGVVQPLGAGELLSGLHGALRGTRGAGAMIGVFDRGTLEAAGVGNVALRVFGCRFDATATPGILGARMRDVRTTAGKLTAGARVVVFSDGIPQRADFRMALDARGANACERILREHSVAYDDASVLVADVEAL